MNPPFANCQIDRMLKVDVKWGFVLKMHPNYGVYRFEVLASRESGLPERGQLSSFWPTEMQISKMA